LSQASYHDAAHRDVNPGFFTAGKHFVIFGQAAPRGQPCVADTLKNAVRLTFPKGAQIKDPKKLFNTRLDSKTVRAIDFYEGVTVDTAALKALILEAVGVNTSKVHKQYAIKIAYALAEHHGRS